MKWNKKKVLITGGASFIGSHLVEALLKKGADILVVDDLSSGKLENIKKLVDKKNIEFIKSNLLDQKLTQKVTKNIDVVFHLAGAHGGRGYIDTHQAECASNFILDGLVFQACLKNKVEKVIFTSSGCVYPNFKQEDVRERLFLKEEMVGSPYDPDNIYGWAKLTAEMTLRAYSKEYGLKSVCCRYFTVFGERAKEDHAVIALIAKAFIHQNPYEVWGTGEQLRNWTHVSDIVQGTILAAEKIDDGRAINLGTKERIKVIEAVKEIFKYTNFYPEIKFLKNMPTGPYNRVADNNLAKKILGWEPKVKFIDGLHQTIDWYFVTKDKKEVKSLLKKKLMER